MWRIEAERLSDVQVPPSLTALLQARGPPAARRTHRLQQALVVGCWFWIKRSPISSKKAGRQAGC